MLKYKIGDTVKIKSRLNTNYNYFKVTDEMQKFEGQIATVISWVYSDIFDPLPFKLVGYKLNIDNGYYGWEDCMFDEILCS